MELTNGCYSGVSGVARVYSPPCPWDTRYQFSIKKLYFQRKMLALGFCLLQPCPQRWAQVCRVKIMSDLLPNNWFVSTRTNSMKCFINWIPLNTHVRSAVCVPLRRNGNRLVRNGKRIHEGYKQSYGNGKGTGNIPFQKKLSASASNFFLRIASESEKVFARILDEFFRCLDLPKINVFSRRTVQNFMTLTPPLVF